MAVLLIASIKHAKMILPTIYIHVISSPALFKQTTLDIASTSLRILKIKCVLHGMLNLLNFIQLRLLLGKLTDLYICRRDA